MMNPKYKFELVVALNGATANYDINPIWNTNAAKVYELEQNQKFFRAKFDGKLLFIRDDFAIINNANFESQFVVNLYISWNNGESWNEYWKGEFYKTDCSFDVDNQTVQVTPTPLDDYTDVLAGMEKEFNLVELKPAIENIVVTKRPLLQIYVLGENVVSCFLSGMAWEQDCEPITNANTLVNTYHFRLLSEKTGGQIVSGASEETANGEWENGHSGDNAFYWTYETKEEWETTGEGGYVTYYYTYLTRRSDGVRLYANRSGYDYATGNFTMYEINDEERNPVVSVAPLTASVYGRYLLDVEQYGNQPTFAIPVNDIVENNRNYRRVIGYPQSGIIFYTSETSTTPTEWGIKQPGEYFVEPNILGVHKYYPVGRSHWGAFSIWYAIIDYNVEDATERPGRKQYVMKDATPLSSVISVLLAQIAPGITYEATPEYSHFLYDDSNPVAGTIGELFISQKSNILAGDYQTPAQKAPITLKMVTDMLRDCFRCYWYIENKMFHVEHISWFMNGGTYSGTPVISHDLTTEQVTRNNKKWAFGTNQYGFNKPTMPESYQFGWMDDVTRAFEGYPINVISRFVERGNIEEITVANFNADIDYMLLNPGGCSKDGFALMGAVMDNIITPDSDYIALTSGYDVRYQIAGGLIQYWKPNDPLTIKFYVRGGTPCEVVFLDENGEYMQTIDSFKTSTSQPTLITMAVLFPENATYISIRKLQSRGNVTIKMVSVTGEKYLPMVTNYAKGVRYVNQNGNLAFIRLQNLYYKHDMPAYKIEINGIATTAESIERNKQQSVRFPVMNDPNPTQLIKTFTGNGQIEKITINLSSRNANAALLYDTYQNE